MLLRVDFSVHEYKCTYIKKLENLYQDQEAPLKEEMTTNIEVWLTDTKAIYNNSSPNPKKVN